MASSFIKHLIDLLRHCVAGIHKCNITAEDSDNGESPRLQYCFACCNKQDCSNKCLVYSNPDCKQIRCACWCLTASFSINQVYTQGFNSQFLDNSGAHARPAFLINHVYTQVFDGQFSRQIRRTRTCLTVSFSRQIRCACKTASSFWQSTYCIYEPMIMTYGFVVDV